MTKKKSYNEIRDQFDRIWHIAIHKHPMYKKLIAENPKDIAFAFQCVDRYLRNSRKPEDVIVNSRINKADSVCTKYLRNLFRAVDYKYSDMTPYSIYRLSDEEQATYEKWKKKKYSYAVYAGTSASKKAA